MMMLIVIIMIIVIVMIMIISKKTENSIESTDFKRKLALKANIDIDRGALILSELAASALLLFVVFHFIIK